MNRPFDGLAAQLAAQLAAVVTPVEAKQAKTRLRDSVKLHPLTISNAAEVAKKQKAARRRKPAKKSPVIVNSVTVRIPREIMETALRLADGDMRRIVLQPDGSAIVYNHPRTSPVIPRIRNRGTALQ